MTVTAELVDLGLDIDLGLDLSLGWGHGEGLEWCMGPVGSVACGVPCS